jgi:phage tail tape-measure protein
MVLERALILTLSLAVVGVGTTAALTRPMVFRLGQEGTPSASSGVTYRGSSRAGRWVTRERPRDWSRFQGRGPGGAK